MDMDRIKLIQQIIEKNKFDSYLEIGSKTGTSFLPVRCAHKAAVDPEFKITKLKKMWWDFKNPLNKTNSYFEETSDDFFLKRKDYLASVGKLDVVLVDGLHTYEAALKDVLNALKYLNEKGTIVMHDCLPPNEQAATPMRKIPGTDQFEERTWGGNWCGDVWKVITYLRRNYADSLDAYVIDTDFGLGVVKPKRKLDIDLEINLDLFNEIDKISYTELMQNVDSMLALKDVEFAKTLS